MTAQDLRKVLEQTDEKIILQMINNDNIMSGIDSYYIVSMIEKMNDSIKQQVLHNQEFIEKHQINSYDLEGIISSLTEEKKAEVLMDIDLIKNKLHLEDYKITKILKELPSDRAKDKAIEIYQFENYEKIDVLKTCSDSHKLDILMKEESFTKYNIIDILQTLDIKTMSEFLVEQKEICIEKQIHPYEIVKSLETDKQREFVERLGDIDLTFNEKKKF